MSAKGKRREWIWEKGEVHEPNVKDGWGGGEWSGTFKLDEYDLDVFVSERTGHPGQYHWVAGAAGPQTDGYFINAAGHTSSLDEGKTLAEDWARRIHRFLREIPVAEEGKA